MFNKSLLTLICLSLLTACAPALMSTKIDQNAAPVKDITLAVTMGNMAQIAMIGEGERYKILDAIHDRIPDIFNKNGLVTKEVFVEGLESANATSLYPLTLTQNAKTSHVLLLKASKLTMNARTPISFEFDAQLIDVKTKKVVWRGNPRYFFGNQYNIHAQLVAGALLNALQSDGFLKMPNASAIDLEGNKIIFYYPGLTYKGQDR